MAFSVKILAIFVLANVLEITLCNPVKNQDSLTSFAESRIERNAQNCCSRRRGQRRSDNSNDWLVEIHIKALHKDTFCFGALVSDRHIVTSAECAWLTRKLTGNSPYAELQDGRRLPLATTFSSSLPTSFDNSYALGIFTLLEPDDSLDCLCLPSDPDPAMIQDLDLPCQAKLKTSDVFCSVESRYEEPDDNIEATTTEPVQTLSMANADIEALAQMECDNVRDVRIAGYPSAIYNQDEDRLELQGIRINTCKNYGLPLYIYAAGYTKFLEAETTWFPENSESGEEITYINGVCPPTVRTVGKFTVCDRDGDKAWPATVLQTKSKLSCDGEWEVIENNDDDSKIKIACRNGDSLTDAEIVAVAKSNVMCRGQACQPEGGDDNFKASLDDLHENCISPREFLNDDDIFEEIEEVTDCQFLSSILETTEEVEATTVHGDGEVDEADHHQPEQVAVGVTDTEGAGQQPNVDTRINKEAEEGINYFSCPTHSVGEKSSSTFRCQFPFEYKGELRFECVKLTGSDERARCPVDKDQQIWLPCSDSCPLMSYHKHRDLIAELQKMFEEYPQFTELFSVGKSLKGRELLGIRLRNKATPNSDLRPMVKLVGNMHGNEPTGREMLIHLARYILLVANSDLVIQPNTLAFRAKRLLETTDLWLLPTMNPDGFARGQEGRCSGGNYQAGRTNERKVDLNRNFPTWEDALALGPVLGNDLDALGRDKEHETQIMMRFIHSQPFVLSANFHDGAVLVNYPFDDYRTNASLAAKGVSKTPDHDVFYHLATSYASQHPYMEDTSQECPHWGYFENGVTNGADWYVVKGGMQDYNYDFTNALEVTVEVSCCKYPFAKRLTTEWENNFRSILNYTEQAQRGIRGYVTDEDGKPVANAVIQVQKIGEDPDWRGKNITTDARGRYWRILLPGKYFARAVYAPAPGQEGEVLTSEVMEVDLKYVTKVDFTVIGEEIGVDERNFELNLPPTTTQPPPEPEGRGSILFTPQLRPQGPNLPVLGR